jgi:hypothetical protein
VDSALSTSGASVAPTAATLANAYGFTSAADFVGGLYLVVLQTGESGQALGSPAGLSEGQIGDGGGAGKNPLVANDPTSKFEIFRVLRATGATLTLDPAKRLADYFTIPGNPHLRAVMLFEPHTARMATVPGSGDGVGKEQAFVVVPPTEAAKGEDFPPHNVWLGGGFDNNDGANVGVPSEYSSRVALPIPRPLERRPGRAQRDSDPPVILTAGTQVIIDASSVFSPLATAADVGKIMRVHRVSRTGDAPFQAPEGDNTTEDTFLGWFEIVGGDFGPVPRKYHVRRIPEVDPSTGAVFWGSDRSLIIDDSSLSGDVNLEFTLHEPISALHSATYNDLDKLDSARLTNLIDPTWVERSGKTLAALEGSSTVRPDRAIWDTSANGTSGANPGSMLDLGFRMVLYPAKEGAGAFAGQMVPDYDNPIESREAVLDPAIDEPQWIDIDYSSGLVTLSHPPAPGAGCDVAPNGIITSDNPRGEVALFTACVPYSQEDGQLGGGFRTTATVTPSGSGGGCSGTPGSADVYGGRLSYELAPNIRSSGFTPQVVASGPGLVIDLLDVASDLPDTGFIDIRVGSEGGPSAIATHLDAPSLAVYGYTSKNTALDTDRGVQHTRLEGVFGGGVYGVDTFSATGTVAVLRRDIRTPVSVGGVAGTNYEHDLSYGFAKKSSVVRFKDASLVPQPDGSMVVETEAVGSSANSRALFNDLFSSWAIDGGGLTFPGGADVDVAETTVVIQGVRSIVPASTVTLTLTPSQEHYIYVSGADPECPSYAVGTSLPLPGTQDALLGRVDTGAAATAATGFMTPTGVSPGDTCRISGVTFTGIVGPRAPGSQDFNAAGGDIPAAGELVAAINDAASQALITAAVPVGVSVTAAHTGPGTASLTATVVGTIGNSILLDPTIPGNIPPGVVVSPSKSMSGGTDFQADSASYVPLQMHLRDVDRRVDITVGQHVGKPGTVHFDTLGEAFAYIGETAEPPSGTSGRSWRIQVVGYTNEAGAPIVVPTDGIIVEGAAIRRAGGPGTQTTVRWSATTALFDLNGRKDLVFENLAFEYQNTGQPDNTSGLQAVFANDRSTVGGLTVERLTVRNCRLKGNTRANGFFVLGSPTSGMVDSRIENCEAEVSDFFFVSTQIIQRCTFSGNRVIKDSASQMPDSFIAGFLVFASFIEDNQFLDNVISFPGDPGFFERGIALNTTIATPTRSRIERNQMSATVEIGIHLEGAGTGGDVIRANRLNSVHTSGSFSYGQTDKIGIWVEGAAAIDVVVEDNAVTISGVTANSDRGVLVVGDRASVMRNETDARIEVGDESELGHNQCPYSTTGVRTMAHQNRVSTGASFGNFNTITDNRLGDVAGMGFGCIFEGNVVTAGKVPVVTDCVLVGNKISVLNTAAPAYRVVLRDNVIVGGTGAGLRIFHSTISGNRVLADFFVGTVASDAEYNDISDNILGMPEVTGQTAQGGTEPPTTITLDASSIAVDDFYAGYFLTITGGTGVGQEMFIQSYDGTTQVATGTVTIGPSAPDWNPAPDNTSTYDLLVPGYDLQVYGNHNTVTGNILDVRGVLKLYGDYNRVESNTAGLLQNPPAGSNVGTTILGNTFTGTGAGTVFETNADGARISNNVFTGSGVTIDVRGANCEFSDNSIGGSPGCTLAVSTADSVVVASNSLGAGSVITLVTCSQAVVANNRLATDGGVGVAIYLDVCEKAVVQGNITGGTGGRIDVRNSANVTIDGNFVEDDILVFSNPAHTNLSPQAVVRGNQVAGVIDTASNDECIVEGNQCGGDIQVYGNRCAINGNHLDGNDIVGDDGGGNTANNCGIHSNVNVGVINFPSPGATHNVSHNLGAQGDWTIGGGNCIITGNTLALYKLISPGIGSIIIGNNCDGIRFSAGSTTPRPASVITVANRVGTGQIFGVGPAGPNTDNNTA